MSRITTAGVLLVVLVVTDLYAQNGERAQGVLTESCRSFAQSFYDWYLTKAAVADHGGAPEPDLALKGKRSAFSGGLYRALLKDFEAQPKSNEITGIDFDPFLNTQDPCQKYEVGDIVAKGSSYWAEVYGVCDGKKHQKPDLMAELAFQEGRWVFVNFHYPSYEKSKDRNLLSLLRALSKSSASAPKQ